MKNTGLARREVFDPLDAYIGDFEFGSSDNKTRWGMSDSDIKKLTKKNQRKIPACVGYTASSMMEKLYGKEYSARYAYVNTDRLFEASNKGGLQTINVFKFLSMFGIVRERYVEDKSRLDYDEYYRDTPNIDVKASKQKLGAYMRIESNIKSIKNALDNLDIVAVSVRSYRTSRRRFLGKRIRRFLYDKTNLQGHAMMVTHMRLIDGKYYIYVWNSWGDGQAVISVEDFPQYKLSFVGGTLDKAIVKAVQSVVKHNKKFQPTYKYFLPKEVPGLEPHFVMKLDEARGYSDTSYVLNSGYRTPSHNKRVGGVPDSAHLSRLAVDIKCTSSSKRWKIVEGLREAGFKRIGIAKTFIHVDMDESKPQEVYWIYS